jgi:hypothetical protein
VSLTTTSSIFLFSEMRYSAAATVSGTPCLAAHSVQAQSSVIPKRLAVPR